MVVVVVIAAAAVVVAVAASIVFLVIKPVAFDVVTVVVVVVLLLVVVVVVVVASGTAAAIIMQDSFIKNCNASRASVFHVGFGVREPFRLDSSRIFVKDSTRILSNHTSHSPLRINQNYASFVEHMCHRCILYVK